MNKIKPNPNKPWFCKNKYTRTCKGCYYNEVPELSDGGCKLWQEYEAKEGDSHDEQQRT